MLTRDLKVEINREIVLHQIDCHRDSDFYEEIIEEYEEIYEDMLALSRPLMLMEVGKIPKELASDLYPEGTDILAVITSIGAGISTFSTESFSKGDYVKGMLADAMADSALFSLEEAVKPYLKAFCEENKVGIRLRLEAPNDIPMTFQKFAWELTRAKEIADIDISSGYMLNPLKSNVSIYVLTEDQSEFRFEHNCRSCKNYSCKNRNVPPVPVEVRDGRKNITLMVKEGESILQSLMKADSSYTAVCGGTGKCGKCKIQIVHGYLPVSMFDEAVFTKEELAQGLRLSCKAYPEEPLVVMLNFKSESAFRIVSEYEKKETASAEGVDIDPKHELGIAVDIGTTTIAVQLLNLEKKERLFTHTTINHQRSLGADVISRIKASVEGKSEELQESIRNDLDRGVRYVVEQAGASREKITEVAIAGNTTMIHLLMGYDCKGLGEYPFTPVNISLIEDSYENIMGSTFLKAHVRILPGISTFVGGDIVSGLYSCDVDEKETYSLLIDLGTNGEIALGNRHKLMATSTAAGPAFEGGNIEWGVGSIEGAIAGVRLEEDGIKIQTIGNKTPTGICGTGVVEVTAELVKKELVDETGCLDDEYFDEGYPLAKTEEGEIILFTQKDVREIQLAKAAVRAGIETLILRYGIKKADIERVYLAGGFGFKLDCEKAIEIGMIPEEFSDKIQAVGNSSLGGAVKCLLSKDGWRRTEMISSRAAEINLSADKDFNEFYMEYMYFERR